MNKNLLEKHAKSFYWASFFLSREIFKKCSALYNFCRTLDDIADDINQLDIKKAIKTLNNLRQYNFSQGAVVRNEKVVSIEGKGGTKKMLEKSRSKKLRNHGVLVKLPKKKQDLRIDLPTIGFKTLKQSKTAGLKGIVVKYKQHVFLDKSKCINFANKNKMFITVK